MSKMIAAFKPTPALTLAAAAVGWRAFDAKDYTTALAFFEPYRDDPIGQYFIGAIYLDDKSLQGKRLEALDLLKRSAAADTHFAWLALGNYYADEASEDHDFRQAINWYARGAEYGCSSSQVNLGWCYCRLEEFALASKWLFISAVLGAEKGKHLFNLLFVRVTNDEYEEGCHTAIEWLESKLDADHRFIHPHLANWLSEFKDSSETVTDALSRIFVQHS